jgi:hypothetical protein
MKSIARYLAGGLVLLSPLAANVVSMLTMPAIAFATASRAAESRPAVSHDGRKVQQPKQPAPLAVPSGILRQDLFDRNNPNNLRSDWPGPPAQPAQF